MNTPPAPGATARTRTGPKILEGCDFCDELRGHHDTVFSRLYAGLLSSRIVCRDAGFVAFPTIGQLGPGHLLVCPFEHVDSLAALPPRRYADLERIASALSRVVASHGRVVMFEHGAREGTGAGCGIYHAHLHLVPVPRAIACGEMLPAPYHPFPSIPDALRTLRGAREYLLFSGGDGCGAVDLSARQAELPSQYLRRRLFEHVGRSGAWDWRSIRGPERELIDTVASLGRPGHGPHALG